MLTSRRRQPGAEIVVPVLRSSAGERNARRVVLLDSSKLWGKVDPEAKSVVQASEVGQVTDLPGEAGDDAVMP